MCKNMNAIDHQDLDKLNTSLNNITNIPLDCFDHTPDIIEIEL